VTMTRRAVLTHPCRLGFLGCCLFVLQADGAHDVVLVVHDVRHGGPRGLGGGPGGGGGILVLLLKVVIVVVLELVLVLHATRSGAPELCAVASVKDWQSLVVKHFCLDCLTLNSAVGQ